LHNFASHLQFCKTFTTFRFWSFAQPQIKRIHLITKWILSMYQGENFKQLFTHRKKVFSVKCHRIITIERSRNLNLNTSYPKKIILWKNRVPPTPNICTYVHSHDTKVEFQIDNSCQPFTHMYLMFLFWSQSYDLGIHNCNASVVGNRLERFSRQKKILLLSKYTRLLVVL
jgi:hypothetical protein